MAFTTYEQAGVTYERPIPYNGEETAAKNLGAGDREDDWVIERIYETQAQRQRREVQQKEQSGKLARMKRQRRQAGQAMVLLEAMYE